MNFNRFRLAFAILLVSVTCVFAATKPNVILIMADDLGYADLSCYGSTKIKTPALDTMAKEGVRLTSYYCGNTVCTPSRIALMTGAYPRRAGWHGGVGGWKINPKNGLAPEALTIAEAFKSAGYATAITGKWHLGETTQLLPMNQGFDHAYYITKSNNQTKKLYRGDKLLEDPFENRRLSEQFTAEAIKFIKADRDKPFFLYMPYTAPHFPAQAHPDWKGKSNNDAYGDVVEELDHRIGQLLQALKDQEIDEQTIVMFISDNGPDPSQRKWARSTPYRGLKWSALEGGNRVPCIVRWPGTIPAGHVSEHMVAAIDVFPTLASACGIDFAKLPNAIPKIDGVNVWNTLAHLKGGRHPRTELLFWHGWATPQAIRVGDWKLYFDKIKELPATNNGPALFNLKNDPAEQTNLSDKHPDQVKTMLAKAREQLAEIENNSIPLGGPPSKNPKPKDAAWLK